jgi:outer membrane protein OmpA-like peptidoglycan-associated protein
MKTPQFLILVTFVALFAGCATVAPNELVNARSAYRHASEGPAEQLVPAELHKAHDALVLAEQSFLKEPDSHKTKDLAYVAQRKSEQAGALGAMAADKAKKDKANADFQKKQAEIVKQGKQDLSDSEKRTAEVQAELDTLAAVKASKDKSDADFQKQQAEIMRQGKQDLSDSEKRTADARAELDKLAADKASKDKADADFQKQQQDEIVKQGKQDLIDSEKRTAVALAELAKLAAVKEEERGLVLTLSGSVLFRSAESTLLSSAQVKLGQVANALLAVRARNLIVEGHTDSQGSESYNQGLSQRRADAVRDYLVQRGYPADRIQARGKGKGSPIADNASPEGRANNRRVEIVIEREFQTPNP